MPYYFEVATQESHWTLPDEPDLTVIDKTQDEKAKQIAEVESFKQRML